MNPSSSNPPNETNIEKEFPKILPDFEYLLSETETQIFIIDKDLEENYKILDLAINHRADHDNFYPFRRYIIRQNKRIWELHKRAEELKEILKTKIIKIDSQFYSFYLEQYRINT